MTPFERALEFVLLHEGGYVWDEEDTGGETHYGISKRQYPLTDVKNLTMAQAGEIYKRDYYDACKCGEMPEAIGFAVFDSAVNQGQGTAIRMLQTALRVKSDGFVGPQTLQAVAAVKPADILPKFIARRAFAYAQTPNLVRFGVGWFTRLAECHQAAMKKED